VVDAVATIQMAKIDDGMETQMSFLMANLQKDDVLKKLEKEVRTDGHEKISPTPCTFSGLGGQGRISDVRHQGERRLQNNLGSSYR